MVSISSIPFNMAINLIRYCHPFIVRGHANGRVTNCDPIWWERKCVSRRRVQGSSGASAGADYRADP
ncbi:hypothetical protein CEXT_314761 [Caerostris extrusa]|uniref:Uncharacterized protein n=1 Tax=Caerostris extrusa TaxID=172846 RepID=A0AAV4NRQ2_CAEEX|nr:hypothetical protein CEXT_314761 [Caerostris extrusa]